MAKVLLVDDNIDFCLLIADFLREQGHVVDTAHDSNAGLELTRLYEYDVLILDWELPGGMTGVEICKQYRGTGGSAKVIMLTGHAEASDKEEGLDSGADDYMCKPPHPVELAARIRALLRRPANVVAEVLTVGHLTLDPRTRVVKCAGATISLLPREFAVLEFLMRHPNRVFASEELLNGVWEASKDVSPDTVRVCIQRLRSKIAVNGYKSPIKNIYGVGYQLDATQ